MKEKFRVSKVDGTINLRLKGTGKRWHADKLTLCKQIVEVVERYLDQGYRLTLRQLYYQLVAAEYIPNHLTVYKKLSSVLDDLRYGGYIDWDAIEDRGRKPYIPYFVEGVKDALLDTARYYRLDRQRGQDTVVEVWTEKDAISGILRRITEKYHVQLVVNKGYSSSTAMHRAYQRFADYINAGKKVVVLYFGDHDPSGLDMIRDIEERIMYFLANGDKYKITTEIRSWCVDNLNGKDYGEDGMAAINKMMAWADNGKKRPIPSSVQKAIEIYEEATAKAYIRKKELFVVKPIGLTMDQINEFNPPPNPAKEDDPRAKWYIEQYGAVSWEVDAIEPKIMEGIVDKAIREAIDMPTFTATCQMEQAEKREIIAFANHYQEEE